MGLTGSGWTRPCPPGSRPPFSLAETRALTFWASADSRVVSPLPRPHGPMSTKPAYFLGSRTQVQKLLSENLCQYVHIGSVDVPDKPGCVCVRARKRERLRLTPWCGQWKGSSVETTNALCGRRGPPLTSLHLSFPLVTGVYMGSAPRASDSWTSCSCRLSPRPGLSLLGSVHLQQEGSRQSTCHLPLPGSAAGNGSASRIQGPPPE